MVLKHIVDGLNTIGEYGGKRIGAELYHARINKSAKTANTIGKAATYGIIGGSAIGVVSNIDEYSGGIGNGVIKTTTGSIGGAGLGAIGGASIGAIAAAIAKGAR